MCLRINETTLPKLFVISEYELTHGVRRSSFKLQFLVYWEKSPKCSEFQFSHLLKKDTQVGVISYRKGKVCTSHNVIYQLQLSQWLLIGKSPMTVIRISKVTLASTSLFKLSINPVNVKYFLEKVLGIFIHHRHALNSQFHLFPN